MIGAPTLNPQQGDRRQKALGAAVAARLRSMSRLSKTGVGTGSRTGAGIRPVAPGGGRPSGVLNFLSDKSPGGFGPGGANFFGVNPGLGSLPGPAQSAPGRLPGSPPGGGSAFSGLPGTQMGPPPVDGLMDNGVPYVPPFAGPAPSYDVPLYDWNKGGSTFMAGGVIPLGGGVFYDPETGALRGGGLV